LSRFALMSDSAFPNETLVPGCRLAAAPGQLVCPRTGQIPPSAVLAAGRCGVWTGLASLPRSVVVPLLIDQAAPAPIRLQQRAWTRGRACRVSRHGSCSDVIASGSSSLPATGTFRWTRRAALADRTPSHLGRARRMGALLGLGLRLGSGGPGPVALDRPGPAIAGTMGEAPVAVAAVVVSRSHS
jgi:hypothetical protein